MTCGNVLVQLQIDNAVPPPMGTAVVFDIRKCVSAKEEREGRHSVKCKLHDLQIDNAVPPPMGTAIVFDIRKCVSAKEERRKTQHEMQIT